MNKVKKAILRASLEGEKTEVPLGRWSYHIGNGGTAEFFREHVGITSAEPAPHHGGTITVDSTDERDALEAMEDYAVFRLSTGRYEKEWSLTDTERRNYLKVPSDLFPDEVEEVYIRTVEWVDHRLDKLDAFRVTWGSSKWVKYVSGKTCDIVVNIHDIQDLIGELQGIINEVRGKDKTLTLQKIKRAFSLHNGPYDNNVVRFFDTTGIQATKYDLGSGPKGTVWRVPPRDYKKYRDLTKSLEAHYIGVGNTNDPLGAEFDRLFQRVTDHPSRQMMMVHAIIGKGWPGVWLMNRDEVLVDPNIFDFEGLAEEYLKMAEVYVTPEMLELQNLVESHPQMEFEKYQGNRFISVRDGGIEVFRIMVGNKARLVTSMLEEFMREYF